MAVNNLGRPGFSQGGQQATPFRQQPMNNPTYQAPAQPQAQHSNANQGRQAQQPNQALPGAAPSFNQGQQAAQIRGQWQQAQQQWAPAPGTPDNRPAMAGAQQQQQAPPPQAPPQQQQRTVATNGMDLARGDVRDQYRNVLKQFPATPDGVKQAMAANPQMFAGVNVAGTHGDKLDFGNGIIIDSVQNAASGDPNQMKHGWQDPFNNYGQGGATGFAAGGAMGAAGQMMGQSMTPAQQAGVGGFGVQNGRFTYGGIAQPGSYQPGQVDQFNGPNQGGMENQQQNMIQQLMASGGSMGPQVQEMMMRKNQESAEAQYKALQGSMGQNAAGRGMGGGGWQNANDRRLGENKITNVLQGNRDIGIQAAQTNFNDQLNASQASNQFLDGQMGRATDSYNTRLGGQLSQEGLNRQGTQDSFSQWLSGAQLGEGGRQADLSHFINQGQLGLGQQQIGLGYHNANLNDKAAMGNLGLGYKQLSYQNARDTNQFATPPRTQR